MTHLESACAFEKDFRRIQTPNVARSGCEGILFWLIAAQSDDTAAFASALGRSSGRPRLGQMRSVPSLAAFNQAIDKAPLHARHVALLDFRALQSHPDWVTALLALRQDMPDLCVMMRDSRLDTDFGHERLPLCDITIGGTLRADTLEGYIWLALRNNRRWQRRCNDKMRARMGLPERTLSARRPRFAQVGV